MLVEHAAVPATHLVVALQVSVLHALIRQQIRALLHHVLVDPRRNLPVLFRYDLVADLSVRVLARLPLEFLCERDIIYECPRIVKLVVPGALEIFHRLDQLVQLLISDQGEKRGINAIAGGIIGIVVVPVNTVQRLWRLEGFYAVVRTPNPAILGL